MGALLSQAVANQLRQFPRSQDPRPSPPELIQQVLNQPGPSMPTWMGPVMERQQLLALNTPEANRAAAQDALRMAMAFGGADITKEQRAAWEAENEAFRKELSGNKGLEPGTRVIDSPEPGTLGAPTGRWHGIIVTPGTPEAGKFAQRDMGFSPNHPPGPDYVAVRHPDTPWWFWRRRTQLEVLPPKELRPGVRVLDGGFPGEKPEEAIVVDHNDPKEKPGFIGRKRLQPSPDHVAIRKPGSKEYYWRHPDELEILPPKKKK